MQIWQQNYDPLNNIWLSSLIALLPVLFFFFALIRLKMKGYQAATLTVVLALLVALLLYRMPLQQALASAIYGFMYGLWPIAWIIVAAVFVYKISVKTGQFDIIRASILSITPDQRLQMLIVGFSFGAFLEGAAGFGAPVAITAALLVGLGFNPLYAAGLCLIVNTAPVAFGAMGIPIIVAGQVTGLDSFAIGQMAGRQLPLLTIVVLFWIMAIMDGWRGVKETWPAVIVAGGSVRDCPVPQLQLSGTGAARYYLLARLTHFADAVFTRLAAGAHLSLQRNRKPARGPACEPAKIHDRAGGARLDAIPVSDGNRHVMEHSSL